MRIFLAARKDVDLSIVRSVLAELRVELASPPLLLDDDAVSGRELDGVVAIVGGPGPLNDDRHVYFELGLAVGLGLPHIVLAEESLPVAEPFLALGAVHMPAVLTNREALRFHLGLFITGLSVKRDGAGLRPKPVTLTRPQIFEIQSSVVTPAPLDPVGRELQLVAAVETVFRLSGSHMAEPFDKSNRGFDFVAAMPGLESLRGPVLVEVKRSIQGTAFATAVARLQSIVLQEGAGLGVVIYDDAAGSSASLPPLSEVVVLGFRELLEGLQSSPLARLLVRRRNELAHGHGA